MSPYVTECPYCGNRLRKRAPKLEREGDEIRVQESRRERRRRERGAPQAPSIELDGRPVATVVTILLGAVLIILSQAVPLSLPEIGAIVGPVGSDYWRYVTAPFAYDDIGAFIVIATAIGIFGSSVERRLGSLANATLILATGTLGMLAAGAAEAAGVTDSLVAAGGNGIALGLIGAWLMLWRGEAKTHFSEPLDAIGIGVVAAVLLLLPLVEVTADPIAGLVGGLVGLGMGSLAARRSDPNRG